VLITRVLAESSWPEEAARLGRLATGLACGGAAGLAAYAWHAVGAARPSAPAWLLAAVLAGALGAASLRAGTPALPEWERSLASLPSAPPAALADDGALLAAIDELRVAGFSDAENVWLTLALRANGDPDLVRELCARHERVVLPPAWQPLADVGALACAAARAWPEDGARLLAEAADPALARLAADLLMEAGAVAEALDAYERAAAAGDRFARRDAVRA
jgi:hypothetical protein